jgi:endogenous inhibitor of DNA gyrase (YacG/DUF329 family)
MNNREQIECPKCGAVVPLTPKQGDYDDVIVICPKCREQFDRGQSSS